MYIIGADCRLLFLGTILYKVVDNLYTDTCIWYVGTCAISLPGYPGNNRYMDIV